MDNYNQPTPETDAVATYEGNWDTKALRMTDHARRLERERNEARKELEEYRSIAENIGAKKAVSEKEKAIRERDEARAVLERIAHASRSARHKEEDYAEWEKAVFALLDLCEESQAK